MLHLVIADDEPFDHVQLTAPMMPVTLFNVGELMENYRVLTDAVQFSLENWPEEVVEDAASTVTYSSEEYAETESEEEQEDVEDHPSPPGGGGSEHMILEDDYERNISVGDGLQVTIPAQGRHHLFFSSETE